MIVLDTNVLSEVLRPEPDSRVLAWLEEQRRRRLWDVASAMFDEDFAGRVLSFDSDAAGHYAQIGPDLARGLRTGALAIRTIE